MGDCKIREDLVDAFREIEIESLEVQGMQMLLDKLC